ncbi:APC family permease [Paenibacillus sp. GCM10012307]|uniref:APC family permease n=1 Tax=Paenibacillus roseus TaxID=2798579 RepID=A0A934J2Q7_9BACL|nr:APC family permease [Paenibacillus roseus]MBJ6363692.1 APC family permease [Paenibacillus roseus]
MFNILGGVLLFAAVCGIGLFLAVAAQRQAGKGTQSRSSVTPYLQYIQDKHALNALGYAQQLRRNWSGFGTFSASFTSMSILAGAAIYFGPVFSLTGAWGFSVALPLAAVLAFLVGAANAELASANPTSGGCYHWARARGGKAWSWGAAWLRGLSDLGLFILFTGFAAQLLHSSAAGYLGFSEGRISFLLCAGLLLFTQALVVLQGRTIVRVFMRLGVWVQVSIVMAIAGGLFLFIGPRLQPAEYLFSFDPGGTGEVGWGHMLVSLLFMFRLFIGSDAAAYTMEEARQPQLHVPWSVYLAPVYGFIFGYVLMTIMVLTTSSTGGPLYNNFFMTLLSGRWGAWNDWAMSAISAGMFAALWGSGLSVLHTSSRLWFVFSRDRKSVAGRWFAKIPPHSQTPERLIILLTIGAFAAFAVLVAVQPWHHGEGNAWLWLLTGLTLICTSAAFAIPIGLHLSRRLRWREAAPPWHLGRLSLAVHWLSFAGLLLVVAATALYISGISAIIAALTFLCAVVTAQLPSIRRRHPLPPQPVTREELLRIEQQYRHI